jgi:hypothetical protein
MMLSKTGWLALASAVLCIGFGGAGRAEAGGIVITTPAGLSPGDTFRIVFVTDATTVATSSSIGFYNNFVSTDATNEAGGGLVTYNGVALTWSAIASTSTTDAINNVGVTTAPVYLVDGTPIATSTGTTGLWSGSLSIGNPIDEDLRGIVNGGLAVWTGTTPSGAGDPNLQLGNSSGSAELGSTTHVNSSWVSVFPFPTAQPAVLYGISQVLTVQSYVPEPSSLSMAGTAIIGAGCAFGWSRRRKKERRQSTVEQPGTPE